MVKPNVYFSFAYTQKRDIKLFFRGRKRRRLFGVPFFLPLINNLICLVYMQN